MQFITPEWSANKRVNAVVSTRLGGVSQAPFESLNLGLHVDDIESDVLTNREKLSRALSLPSDPIWLNQTHSTDVVVISPDNLTDIHSCDGIFTSLSNVVCAVMTADCLPLFLSNQTGDKVAVIHVGWRGLANGIIENAIALFDEPSKNIIAWAGPCISINNFEIGEEVRAQLKGPDAAYRNSASTGKFFADMYHLTGARLKRLGITNYCHSQHCTYQDEELFFSHRRDQKTGRMVSLIWLD